MQRLDRYKRNTFLNSYSVTSIGIIIIAILAIYYVLDKSKTYKEIQYDKPITDNSFYGLTTKPNWHKIDVGAFSIETPTTYLYTKFRGIDSKVGQISDEVDTILFDYGWYSNDFGEQRNDKRYEINSVKINGRLFTIVKNKNGTGTIGAYTEDLADDNRLSIACYKCDGFENVMEIFKTIKFRE